MGFHCGFSGIGITEMAGRMETPKLKSVQNKRMNLRIFLAFLQILEEFTIGS
jgi:hypothetical protein